MVQVVDPVFFTTNRLTSVPAAPCPPEDLTSSGAVSHGAAGATVVVVLEVVLVLEVLVAAGVVVVLEVEVVDVLVVLVVAAGVPVEHAASTTARGVTRAGRRGLGRIAQRG